MYHPLIMRFSFCLSICGSGSWEFEDLLGQLLIGLSQVVTVRCQLRLQSTEGSAGLDGQCGSLVWPRWAVGQSAYTWPLQHHGLRITGLLLWQLKAPSMSVPMNKMEAVLSFSARALDVMQSLLHSISYKWVTSLPRFKERGHRAWFSMGASCVNEFLSIFFLTTTDGKKINGWNKFIYLFLFWPKELRSMVIRHILACVENIFGGFRFHLEVEINVVVTLI